MIQGFDAVREQFLADFQNLTQRMAVTQAQLSSGLRVQKPSDDPSAVADIVQLEFDVSRAKQTFANLTAIKGEVDSAEGALQNATSLLDQVRSLGVQGATGTQTAASRSTLALQVAQVLEQLVNVTRTTYQGNYVFGGDLAQTAPYQLNLASSNGVDRLSTAPSTRLAQDVSGSQFTLSLTAGQIFDHRNPDDSLASDNVFAAVNNLRLALANNDQAGISTALDSLTQAQDYLAMQHSFYGARQNWIASALDTSQKFQLQWESTLTQVRDTDIASASTELASENLSQQAALQAQASMRRTSLFDYLK